MKLVIRLSFFLGILTLIPAEVFAQNAQPAAPDQSQVLRSDEVVRTNTRLVVVDVVATKKGEQVPNLKVEDFTLLEDGTPQKISGFTIQGANAVKITPPPQLPENVVTNMPPSIKQPERDLI